MDLRASQFNKTVQRLPSGKQGELLTLGIIANFEDESAACWEGE